MDHSGSFAKHCTVASGNAATREEMQRHRRPMAQFNETEMEIRPSLRKKAREGQTGVRTERKETTTEKRAREPGAITRLCSSMCFFSHQSEQHEELTTAVAQRSSEVDGCHNPDGKIDYLRTVTPESAENGQEKCPGLSYEEGAKKTSTWLTYKRKREMPAIDSQSAKTKMGQKMALEHQSLSLLANGSRHVVDFKSQMTVRPENVENGQEKCAGFCYKEGAKKSSTWMTYTRKSRRPACSKFPNSKTDQKTAFFDDNVDSKDDKNENFEPHTPTRKRRRPTLSKSFKRKKEEVAFEPEVSHDNNGQKEYARVKGTSWDRAIELQTKLGAKGLCFIKHMKRSHVSGGYWLGLPAVSCRKYLPTHDVGITLKVGEGQIYDTNYTNYLADRTGLSGGWRGFAIKHELKVGDALVFQLVEPAIFKVHILRADGALSLPSLDTCMGNNRSSKKQEKEGSNEDAKSRRKRKVLRRKVSGDRSDKLATKEATCGSMRSPGPHTDDFTAVESFEDFKIVVSDGLLVLPDRMRKTYYDLCNVRKAFLHRQASPTRAAEMIVETTKIADGIRASSLASLEDLAAWKKTLESFEPLGMDVAFIRKKIDDLLRLLSAPSSFTTAKPEGYEEMEASMAKMYQAVRKLATAPW